MREKIVSLNFWIEKKRYRLGHFTFYPQLCGNTVFTLLSSMPRRGISQKSKAIESSGISRSDFCFINLSNLFEKRTTEKVGVKKGFFQETDPRCSSLWVSKAHERIEAAAALGDAGSHATVTNPFYWKSTNSSHFLLLSSLLFLFIHFRFSPEVMMFVLKTWSLLSIKVTLFSAAVSMHCKNSILDIESKLLKNRREICLN